MRRHTILIGVLALLIGISVPVVGARQGGGKARTLTRQALEDKIRGGWAGQMIGVSFGAPTEFKYNGKINEGQISWTPDMVSNSTRSRLPGTSSGTRMPAPGAC